MSDGGRPLPSVCTLISSPDGLRNAEDGKARANNRTARRQLKRCDGDGPTMAMYEENPLAHADTLTHTQAGRGVDLDSAVRTRNVRDGLNVLQL